MRLITIATLLAAISGSAYADAGSVSAAPSEVAAIRSYFYAGGGYADDGAGGHIFREQMYVERLQPAKGVTRPNPIVFIHGQAQTGTVSSFTFISPYSIYISLHACSVIIILKSPTGDCMGTIIRLLSQGRIRGPSRDMPAVAPHLTINPKEILAN